MSRLGIPLLFVLFGLVGVGMMAGGAFVFHRSTTGPVSEVKVDDCHFTGTGRGRVCTGAFVVGGSLLGSGHVIIGQIEGASDADIGHTLKVRVHGGTAYVPSLRLPIILFVLGAFIAGMLFWQAWALRPRAQTT